MNTRKPALVAVFAGRAVRRRAPGALCAAVCLLTGVAVDAAGATATATKLANPETANRVLDIQIGETDAFLRLAIVCAQSCAVTPGPDGDLILEEIETETTLDLAGLSRVARMLTVTPTGVGSLIDVDADAPLGAPAIHRCNASGLPAICLDFALDDAAMDDASAPDAPSLAAHDVAAVQISDDPTAEDPISEGPISENSISGGPSTPDRSESDEYAGVVRSAPPGFVGPGQQAAPNIVAESPFGDVPVIAFVEAASEPRALVDGDDDQADGSVASRDDAVSGARGFRLAPPERFSPPARLPAPSIVSTETPVKSMASDELRQPPADAGRPADIAQENKDQGKTQPAPTTIAAHRLAPPTSPDASRISSPIAAPVQGEDQAKNRAKNRAKNQANPSGENDGAVPGARDGAVGVTSASLSSAASAASSRDAILPPGYREALTRGQLKGDFRIDVARILGMDLSDDTCSAAHARLQADGWALDAMVDAGFCKAAAGSLAAADKDFERLLSYTPDNYRALVGRGLIAASTGKPDEARQYLQGALDTAPPMQESRRIDAALQGL